MRTTCAILLDRCYSRGIRKVCPVHRRGRPTLVFAPPGRSQYCILRTVCMPYGVIDQQPTSTRAQDTIEVSMAVRSSQHPYIVLWYCGSGFGLLRRVDCKHTLRYQISLIFLLFLSAGGRPRPIMCPDSYKCIPLYVYTNTNKEQYLPSLISSISNSHTIHSCIILPTLIFVVMSAAQS